MLLLFISIFINKAIGGSAPFAGITDVLNSNEDGYFRPQVEYQPWLPAAADLQYNSQINYPVLPHLQQPKSKYRPELFEFPAVSNYPLSPQNEYHHWSDYDLYDIPGDRADMSHSFDEAHADAFDLEYDAGYEDYYLNFADYEYDPGYYEMDVNDYGMEANDYGMEAKDYGMEANDYGMDVNNHGMDVNDYWMDNYLNSQFQGNQPNYHHITSPILNDQYSNSVNPGRHSDPYNFENHFQLPSNNAKRRGKRSTGFIDEVFEDSYQPEVITEDIVEPQEVFYEDLLPIHSEEIVKDDDDFDVFFPPSSPGEAPSSYEAQFADLLMKIKGDKMGNKHPHKGITVKSPVEINLPSDDYDAFPPMPPSGHLSPINVGIPFNQDFSPIASPMHESPINVGNPFDDYTEDFEDYSPLPPQVQESPISVANFRPVVAPFSEPSVTISNPHVPLGDYEEYDPMLPPYEMEIAEPLDVSSPTLDIQNVLDDDYKEFNPMLPPYELEIAKVPNPSFEDSSDVQNSFDDDHEEYNPMLPIHQSNIVKDVQRPQNTVPLNTVDSYLKPMNAPYLRPVGSKPKQSQALKMPSQNLNLQRNFRPQPPVFVMPPMHIPSPHAQNLADNDDTDDDDDVDTQVRVLPPIHLPPEASPESQIPIPTPQQGQSLKMPSQNLNLQRNFRPQPPAFVMPPMHMSSPHAQNLADSDDTDDDEDADTQVRVLPPIHLPPTSHDSDSPLPTPIALRSGFHGLVDGLDNAYGTENSQTQDDLDTENSYLPLPSGPVIVEPVNNDVTNSMRNPVTNPKLLGSSNIQGNWNTMNVNNNRQTVANWQQSGGRFQGTNNRIMPTNNRQQIVQNQQNSQQRLTNNNQWKAQNNRVNQNGMMNMNRNVNQQNMQTNLMRQQNMQNNLMRQQNRQKNVVRQNNMQNNAIRQNDMQNNAIRQNNMQNNMMRKQNMQNNVMMQRNMQNNNVMRQRNMQNNVMRQRNMQNRMNIGNQNQMTDEFTNILGGFSPF